MKVVLLSCLVILVYLHHTVSEECVVDERNPCIATCNGTKFDISNFFDYPITTNGGSFKWSPCQGLECHGQKDVAVCQHADQYYNCGNYTKPVFILDSRSPYRFKIEYPGGEYWRISIFEFMEETAHPDVMVSFLSENPGLQYNFLITGKCVGQPSCIRNEK